MFIFGAIVLGCIAAACALWPLVSSRGSRGVEHSEFMRDLYRDRMAEIDAEQSDADLKSEMQEERGAVLLAEHQDESTLADSPRGTGLLASVAVVTALLGYGLYVFVADIGSLEVEGAEAVLELSVESHRAQIERWAEVLTERASAAPEDYKSSYLLGHARLKLEQYQAAAEAFAATHEVVANDATVKMYWLQARYLAARGKLDEVSTRLAEEILAQDPGNAGVLEILALDAFQGGQQARAIGYLNKALQGARDPGRQAALAVALRQARTMLDPAPDGIDVEVASEHSVPKQATVFVIARPVGGGMPYAVAKRPALMLPVTVTLDDLVSMSEARTLSAAEDFEIAVRLSLSGVAMAHPGDWEWVSDALQAATLGKDQTLVAKLVPPEHEGN